MDLFDKKEIDPMLIAEDHPPFDDPDYTYELKFDGVRCIAYLDRTQGTVLRNKRNKDITAIYPELRQCHKQLSKGVKRCILDGEVYVFKDGRTVFSEIQRRSLMTNPFKIDLAANKLPVTFTAFDILYQNGEKLNYKPWIERASMLDAAISESKHMNYSRRIERQGLALYEAAASRGLEGIVAKRKDSKYYFGKRTKDWIKCKAQIDEDFIVCGFYFKAANLLSVILGQFVSSRIEYQGHVVMGVSRQDYKIMSAADHIGKNSYYESFPDFDGATWLSPSLVCIVRYMERTKNDGLRQPIYKGLRDDKEPSDCIKLG